MFSGAQAKKGGKHGASKRKPDASFQKAGIDLSGEGEGSKGDTAQNRRHGLGALSGHVAGLGVGTGYGLFRSSLKGGSKLRTGIVPGLAAMAGSETPVTAPGATDLRQGSLNSWVSDTVPHLTYGLTAAVAHESLISV